MAKLYVSEFTDLDVTHGGKTLPKAPSLAEQAFSYTGTAAASSAFNAQTHIIRVHTDAICSISIGTNPTATANMARMVAGQTEYFVVKPGDKISAITNT